MNTKKQIYRCAATAIAAVVALAGNALAEPVKYPLKGKLVSAVAADEIDTGTLALNFGTIPAGSVLVLTDICMNSEDDAFIWVRVGGTKVVTFDSDANGGMECVHFSGGYVVPAGQTVQCESNAAPFSCSASGVVVTSTTL